MKMENNLLKQGAEAKLIKFTFYGKPCLIKERFSKKYRHEVLDKSLTTQRIKSEVRAMIRCRTHGIPTPTIYMVDLESNSIYMEYLESAVTVREYIRHAQKHQWDDSHILALADMIGRVIGMIHKNNIVHGDLTTSNMLLTLQTAPTKSIDGEVIIHPADLLKSDPADLRLVLIDFGLSALEGTPEDKGVDLYVLERALLSTHPNTNHIFEAILKAYCKHNLQGASEIIKKLDEVRLRGRKRTMVG